MSFNSYFRTWLHHARAFSMHGRPSSCHLWNY